METRELGIAVVGTGRIGSLRARLAAAHPAVKLLAVSDLDADRARRVAQAAGADERPVMLTLPVPPFHARSPRFNTRSRADRCLEDAITAASESRRPFWRF